MRTVPESQTDKFGVLPSFGGWEVAGRLLDSMDISDILSSGTLQLFRHDRKLFSKFLQAVDDVAPKQRERLIDLGCGFGALSSLLGKSLGFTEVHGIDINDERAATAVQRGLKVSRRDLGKDQVPYPDNYFDMAMSFGVLDHIKTLDNPISEAHRVLKTGGCLSMSTTNLSSWVNRLALLLGYQPRNLEISRNGLFGVHRLYRDLYNCTDSMGRTSSFTLRALEEFLNYHGFEILKKWGARMVPVPDKDPGRFMNTIDRILSKRATLAVRYIIVCKKIK